MMSSGAPSTHTVDIPKLVSSLENHYAKSIDKALPFRTPNFPTFSGIELVPKGEGSYKRLQGVVHRRGYQVRNNRGGN